MTAKFEVYKASSYKRTGQDPVEEWRWRLKSSNGEIIAQSEGYTRKESAERAVEDARTAASEAGVEVED